MQPDLALLVGPPNGSTSTILSCLGDFELEVEAAYTASDALRLLAPEHHSVVVCDLPVSDMTTAGLVSGVRRTSPGTSLILLAGPPRGPELADVVGVGADEIIARPIHRARMIEAVARALYRRRMICDAEQWRDLQADGMEQEVEHELIGGTVEALTRCLEAKDMMSDGHARSVSGLSYMLARHFDLSDAECEEIRIAGSLHDLGKIAVSQAILDKPARLTASEWGEVQRHPSAGAEILRSIPRLSDVATFVRYHHERHDGTGYPDGLLGDETPLPSRIIAVADAYDAMVRPRPYRPQDGLPYAAHEFRSHAGTQWDPNVVDGLFSCVPELQLAAAV